MKKRFLRIVIITFIMLCLLPAGAALAVTFGFNTEEGAYDNTISETNSGYTLQITSSDAMDVVTNYTMDTAVTTEFGGSMPFSATYMDGYAVYIANITAGSNRKPSGTVTVSLTTGKLFSVESFVCGNGGWPDTLTITAGSSTEAFPIAAYSDILITPSSAFDGISSFTLSWEDDGINDAEMYFDNFVITPITNPVITTQPSDASVSSGGNTSFSVDAIGNTLTYQWQVDTSGSGSSFENASDGGVYSGAASALLSITGVISGMNNYLYRCVVTNDGTYNTTSDNAKLTLLDQAPTDIALDNASIPENTASGTKVGGLTTTDPDSSSFTYSLVDSGTYPDNANFTIVGSDLKLNTVPDYENKSSYSIRIRTQDDTGQIYDKTFSISIANVNEAPTGINLSSSGALEHSPVGTPIGTLSGVDPDAGSTFTYSLIAGAGDTDNGSFTINVNELMLGFIPDFEAKDSYSIRVRVSDGSLNYDKQFTVTILDGNDPPTDISVTGGSIAENMAPGSSVGSLSTTDPNAGDTFTYSLAAGAGAADNASFSITGDEITMNASANYEAKNSYSVRIRSMDNHGFYFEKALTITVTNVNEAPTDIALSNNTIAENSAIGTTIGTLSGIDPDAGSSFTFSLPAAGDNASFTISGTSLKLAVVPDYETKDTYSITVRTSDGALFYDEAFTINISDAPDAPTDITLSSSSVLEHCAVGTTVGSLSSTDQDGGTFTYSLAAGVGSTDNASFSITGNTLKVAVSPDYEVKNSYSIRIRTTDSTGLYYEEDFTINVTDGEDPPTDISLSSQSIAENSAAGTTVGTLSSTDMSGAGPFTYSFAVGSGDTDNFSFTIAGDVLKLAVVPNYEVKNSYSIRIRTMNNVTSFYYEKSFTITITDINETPTDINLSGTSIAEHISSGTTVGIISGVDPDAGSTFTYALAAGTGDTDNASFTISGNVLKLAVIPDYETKTTYDIRIRITDNGSLTFEKQFIISVINGNDPPIDLYMSSSSIQENTPSGIIFTAFGCLDINGGSFVYSLVDGTGSTDNDKFTLSGNTLSMSVVPDYETKNIYLIRVRVTDSGGLYYEEAFTIVVENMNETPTDIGLSHNSIAENSTSGTDVGTLSGVDQDAGSTFTYSLVSGTGDTDNASFTITGNMLRTASIFDYEAKNNYSIRIRVTDQSGLWYEKQLTVSVDNVNEAPTDINLSSASVAENSASGTVIGTLSGTDPDTGASFTYSLVAGIGDTDNSCFTITGNELKLAVVPDFETKASYSIRVRVSDGSLTFEKQLTITVTDGNDPPTDIALSSYTTAENTASGTVVASISTTDPDSGSFTYVLAAGTGSSDNASFTISGSDLRLAFVPDFEARTSYEIRIRTTDDGGMYYEKAFTITVTDVNEAPTNVVLSKNNVSENSPSGTAIGTLSGTDPDAGSTFTYSLVSGTGDADNASFTITGSTLQSASVFDYETKDSYSIRIRIIDEGGLWYEKQFTITITAAPSDGGGGSNPPSTPAYSAEVESGTGPDTNLPVTVDSDNGNAGVEVDSGSGLLSEGKTAVITMPSIPGVDTYTLGIPVPNLSTPDEQGALSFNTDAGSVTVPTNMLTGITGISGARAQIAIGQGDKTRLPENVIAAIGNKPLVQLTLSIDGKQTSWNNPDAPVTVSIPYTPTAAELAYPESIVIWYIDGAGNVVTIPNGHYDPVTGTVTVDVTHFSDYAVAYIPVSFSDVAANAWYSKAVSFIAAREITSGTGGGKYSPDAKLTRGEFLVMLMKAYGIDPDTNPADNFSDAGITYYTGYLSAAKRLGITAGIGNNMYAPGNKVTRQEMFTLLYNALKVIGQLPGTHGRAVSEADDQPQGGSGKTLDQFTDAGQIKSWAKDAMTLLVQTGIVGGSAGKLTPLSTANRAEMAQVLYNLLRK